MTPFQRRQAIRKILSDFEKAVRDYPMAERRSVARWIEALECREKGGEVDSAGGCVLCGVRAGEACRQ
jgi:hypothetical protein